MLYIENISFPDRDKEFDFFIGQKLTCYDSYYPMGVLSERMLKQIDFEPITILCGGNGSGKTTALNVIAEKIGSQRFSPFNQSAFFSDYVDMCQIQKTSEPLPDSFIMTSDDVFDYMLNLRMINSGIDTRREELFDIYTHDKNTAFQMKSLADYEQLKKINMAKSKTMSKYVRNNMNDNVREHSNGESAFKYFIEKIEENSLFLLDEPENSMSPQRQLELKNYIQDHARYFNCQFIISTHSPFLLSMQSAKIYDMDSIPVDIKKWTDVTNVRTYFEFFKEHEDEFL